MIVVLDNYDSFVYNLVQYLGEVGAADVAFVRNDAITVAELGRQLLANWLVGVEVRMHRGQQGAVLW